MTPPDRSSSGNYDNRLVFLDGLRGLAAFYVLVFHARWLLWEGYLTGYVTHPDHYSLVGKVLAHVFLAFSYGHQMVMLFFVLSGFVIHLRYATRLKQQDSARFGWRAYVWRRAKRLYPPLLFTMILTFGLDQLGKVWGFPIYSMPTVLNLDIRPIHDPLTAVGNLLFTMSVYVAPWGMNGALWSLAYEWWFYMIYPIFWWLTRRSIPVANGTMAALYVLSFFPALWPVALFRVVFSAMLAWWFGVLLADIYVGRYKLPLWKIAPASFLLIALAPLTILAPPQLPALQVVEDTLWALAFAGVVAGLMAWKNRGGSLSLLERLKPLGDMSYTLYVIHFPILIFISGWLMSRSPTQALPENTGWVFVGMGICLGTAYLAHFFTETPFIRSRPASRPSVA